MIEGVERDIAGSIYLIIVVIRALKVNIRKQLLNIPFNDFHIDWLCELYARPADDIRCVNFHENELSFLFSFISVNSNHDALTEYLYGIGFAWLLLIIVFVFTRMAA